MTELEGIKYTRSADGTHLAYRIAGDGLFDLVFLPEWFFDIEGVFDDALLGPFYRRLASFSRLIIYDKRGVGSSDPVSPADLPSLEVHAADLRAVLDAVGSPRPALFAHGVGGPLAILFCRFRTRAHSRSRTFKHICASRPRRGLPDWCAPVRARPFC